MRQGEVCAIQVPEFAETPFRNGKDEYLYVDTVNCFTAVCYSSYGVLIKKKKAS